MYFSMHLSVLLCVMGFRAWASQIDSFAENFLEAHWPPNRSILVAPGEVAAAVLVGGARETPGSAAAGVGVAAAGEGSAVRVGSDSKETPISAIWVFEIPKERQKNKPQGSNQSNQRSHRCDSEEKKPKQKSSQIKTI